MASDTDESVRSALPHLGQVTVGHHAPGVAVVTLSGEHDVSTQPALERALRLAAAHSNVVVDLSECSFIDSTVINEFFKASKRAHASGERCLLVIPPQQAQVARTARMIGLADFVEVRETAEAAFACLVEEEHEEASDS